MRQATLSIQTEGDTTAIYPDEVCFAFNPNFIELSTAATLGIDALTVTVSDSGGEQSMSVNATVYQGTARIYLSRLLELLVTDPRQCRTAEASVVVSAPGGTDLLSFSTLVIWGNIAVGERFANIGVYDASDSASLARFTRNVVWFRRFPFTVSLFHYTADMDFYGRTDGGRYGTTPLSGLSSALGFEDVDPSAYFPTARHSATIKYRLQTAEEIISVFDRTFDFTFRGGEVALVNLIISDETAGYYLRWIDRHGNLQYFLFAKGETQYKNDPSDDVVPQDEAIGGYYFANVTRTRAIDCTVTLAGCAVGLPADIFGYVATIMTAAVIDMYCGTDRDGEPIWLPVNIQSGTLKHNPRQTLNDLEISFAVPDVGAQSL